MQLFLMIVGLRVLLKVIMLVRVEMKMEKLINFMREFRDLEIQNMMIKIQRMKRKMNITMAQMKIMKEYILEIALQEHRFIEIFVDEVTDSSQKSQFILCFRFLD